MLLRYKSVSPKYMEVDMNHSHETAVFAAELGETPTVDLHEALDTHDGVQELETFLDRQFVAGTPVVRIIHGRGTGAMRQAVHDALSTSPYIVFFKDATGGHSAGGVTFAVLDTR